MYLHKCNLTSSEIAKTLTLIEKLKTNCGVIQKNLSIDESIFDIRSFEFRTVHKRKPIKFGYDLVAVQF